MMLIPQFDFLYQTPEWAALTESRTNLVERFGRAIRRPSFQATTWERTAEAAARSTAA